MDSGYFTLRTVILLSERNVLSYSVSIIRNIGGAVYHSTEQQNELSVGTGSQNEKA